MHIFLLAGEASGDALGGKLMQSLQQKQSNNIRFSGVGGPRMSEKGLTSIFPMEELSLIGFVEIIPHIPHLLKRIDLVVDTILEQKPDVVVTIDAPAFNKRVAKKLRKKGCTIPLVHYVAPTVWAYKPKRAEKMAKLFDHLLVILPFEPPFFEKEGLATTYIGHPIVEESVSDGDGHSFRDQHNIPPESPTICIMPGSRNGELKRLLPVISNTVDIVQDKFSDLHVIILATSRFEKRLQEETTSWSAPVTVTSNISDRANAIAACDIALAKSGTGTLELAIAKLPMVVMYKVNPISAWMLKRMIRVPYVNLINLVLNQPAIPELLQENCTAEKLSASLLKLLDSAEAQEEQKQAMHQAMTQMGYNQSPAPSDRAADAILNIIQPSS